MGALDCLYRNTVRASSETEESREVVRRIFTVAEKIEVLFSHYSLPCFHNQLEVISAVYKKYTSSSLFTSEHEQVLERFCIDHVMCITESRVGGPFPFAIFTKILAKEELLVEEQNSLEEWRVKIERPTAYLTPQILHTALRGSVEILQGDCGQKLSDKLFAIESFIFHKKSAFLLKADCRHQAFIQALIPDQSTIENIALGKKISCLDRAEEKFVVFEQKDAPRLVVFANNPMRLGILRHTVIHYNWSIKPLKWFHLDPEGRFCVVEKLDSLHELSWHTTTFGLDARDVSLANELAALLTHWASSENIPSAISSKDLFVEIEDGEVSIKSFFGLHIDEVVPHDYNRLEQYCWQFAKGNFTIYSFLMKQSFLSKHPVARGYAEIALEVLLEKGQEPIQQQIRTKLCARDIANGAVFMCAKAYVEALLRARKVLILKFRSQLKIKEGPFSDEISKFLVQFHVESGFFSRVHPALESEEFLDYVADQVYNQIRLRFLSLP